MRVLLVEDSNRLQRSIMLGLRSSGFAVDASGNGIEGLRMARSVEYDVLILDLGLPGLDGIELLKQLRGAGSATHVLVLTARDSVEDRVLGLRTGADDYLVKPFAFEELVARVDALVRRRHGVKNPSLRFGSLEIDTAAKMVRVEGQGIELAPREYALLEFLALRKGEVVSRSEIEAHIYDERVDPLSNVVDAAVYALRKKIDPPGLPSFIQTRRGQGYVFLPYTLQNAEPPCEPSEGN
jgi:DNA-binding response OmpR family regulator